MLEPQPKIQERQSATYVRDKSLTHFESAAHASIQLDLIVVHHVISNFERTALTDEDGASILRIESRSREARMLSETDSLIVEGTYMGQEGAGCPAFHVVLPFS